MLLLPLGAWAENYPITVAGIQVTDENAANVLNDVETATVSFTPASDGNPATLTLNGATIDMSAIPGFCPIESSIANLTIQLIGRYNKLIPNSDNINGIRFTDGTTTGNLTFTTSNVVEEYGLLSVEGIYQFSDLTSGYNVTNSFTTGEQTGWSKIESGIPNATNKNVKIDYIAYYDVWIGGARMSSSSLSPVSGGTKYIPSMHTLHLAGYGYSDEIKSGLPEFIVEVSGSNNSVSNITFEGNTPGTIIFKKDESSPTGNNMVEFTGSVKGFSSVTITPPLQLVSPSGIDDPTSDQWNSFTNVKIADFATTYNIAVGGKNVTNANASNILGDGTVSYDSENNILTLNDATIIPESKEYGITYTGTTDLVISLNGTSNVVKGVGGCPAIGYFNNDVQTAPSLTFTNGSETDPCKLQLESVGTATIGGFGSVVNTGLYKIDETILGADQENIYHTTITSTLLSGGSGTSAHPFIVGTADDLKNFAKYVNDGILSTEYIKLGGNIDCTNLTGFEPIGNNTKSFIGTFNGDGNSITGLTFSNTNPDGVSGLFGEIGSIDTNNDAITRGTVKNLTLNGCQFGNGGQNGAIAGYLHYGTIENCTVTSCTISSGNSQSTYSGGITGMVYNGIVKDCTVNGGTNGGTITSSITNSGDGYVYAGGIVAYAYSDSNINGCTVTDVSINSTGNGQNSYSGGIVGYSEATISGNSVKGSTTVNSINNENNETYAGAIVAKKAGGSLTDNYYDFTVKTKTTIGNNDPVEKSDYTQRGIGQDIGQENGCYDIPNQVMMAGTKKVNISVTDLSSDRTLGLGEEMGLTYCLDERDAQQLKALSVLPGSTVSLVVSSENGYKPSFSLSKNDVVVTPTEKFENSSWNIKYVFVMPEDDETATIAFAKDLESKNGDAFIYTLSAGQEAYPYTGEAIEPSISLTTDPQTPATLTKGTDYEIKDYFEVKEGVATPMYEEDGTTPKAPINVGSYKISITGKGNYFGTRELEFTIAKSAVDWSDNRWVAPEAKTDLKYTGEDLELVTAATVPEGVTIKYYTKYSSEQFTQADYDYLESPDEVWTEEVPTGKEIGYYAVFYKVEESDNYLAWGPGEVGIAVNIGRGEATITAGNQTTTYTGSPIEYDKDNITLSPATISKDGIGISYFEPNPDNPDNPISLDGAPTAAGTYTVKITLVDDHFDAETVNATLTIEQLDISEAVITLDNEELTYNGEEQSVNVTKVMAGDIEVAADYYEISGNSSGTEARNYTLIVTAKTVDSSGNPIKNNFMGSAEKQWKIKNRTVTTSELGVSENQPQGTYYSETEDLEVPEGVIAYIITGVNGNNVVTQRVSYIPKGVAVLVEQTTSTENPLTEIPDASQLPLKGTTEPKDVSSISGGTVYVLYKGEFVKSTTGTIPAKRCYLLLANDVAAGTRAFGIIGGGSDGSTAIKSINDEPSTIDNWYDMRGRRIEKPTKGLYILNGKKIVVK